MNILFIHENDWIKKVIYEPHHLSELFSIIGHKVLAIDCREPDFSNLLDGLSTSTLTNFHKVYDDASITLVRPPSLLIKGMNRMTNFLTCKKVIHDVVEKNDIDIIFLYGVATNGLQSLSVAKEFNIPIVFRELDVSHEFVQIPILKQITKFLEKHILTNVTKVYSCTPGLQRYSFKIGTKNEQSEYFPLGVNTNSFKPQKKDQILAKSLGISDQDLVLIFVGTLYSFSGVDYILNNFSEIKTKIPNLKFLIVGGGPDYNKIKQLIEKNKLQKSIILTNFVNQKVIPSYISIADLCLNSFKINAITDQVIPIKIIEYMACKKAVLSTPLQGTIELLPSEEYGITYSPLEKFPESIVTLLKTKNRLIELANKGHLYTHQNHDWSLLADKLLKKFEKLIS